MKRFYTVFAAALFAAAAVAQPSARIARIAGSQSASQNCPIRQQNVKLPQGARKTNQRLSDFIKPSAFATRMKNTAIDQPLISEQPGGTLYSNYYGSETGFSVFWGQVFSTNVDGAAENFVVGNNGEVYLQNAMATLRQNNWIKGEKLEGDTIAFTFPQKYYVQDETDDDGTPTGNKEYFYLWRMLINDEGNDLVPDETSQTIKYVMRNDSIIRVDDAFNGGVILGLATDDGLWVGYGDYLSKWGKLNDKAVTLPATAKPETFQVDYWNENGNEDSRIIKVAIDGNDIYLGSLTDSNPNAWAKGTISGDKVVFTGKTYMGVDESLGYHTYFSPIGSEKVYSDIYEDYIDSLYFEKEITLDYDAQTKTLSSDKGMLAVNVGKNDVYTQALYDGPQMKPWKEVPGAPKDPELIEFSPYDEEMGYGVMQIYMEKNSTDGVLLNPEKIYYNIYFDDDLFTFYPDEYVALTDEMTDVPLNFTDNYDIVADGAMRGIYFFMDGVSTVGIQELYKDGDKVYKSNLVKYTIDEDGGFTGIGGIGIETGAKSVKSVSYTDISGRRVLNLTRGLYIKTVKMADGSQKSMKYVRK